MYRYISLMLFCVTNLCQASTCDVPRDYDAKVIKIKGKACKKVKSRCEPLTDDMELKYEDVIKVSAGGKVMLSFFHPVEEMYRRKRLPASHSGILWHCEKNEINQPLRRLTTRGTERGSGDCLKLTDITLPANLNRDFWMSTGFCPPNTYEQFSLRLYGKGTKSAILNTDDVELNPANLEPGEYRLEFLSETKVVHQANLTLIPRDEYLAKIKNVSWNSRNDDPGIYVEAMAHMLEGFNLIAMNYVDGTAHSDNPLDPKLVMLIQQYALATMKEISQK